jgi:hypothetical protein
MESNYNGCSLQIAERKRLRSANVYRYSAPASIPTAVNHGEDPYSSHRVWRPNIVSILATGMMMIIQIKYCIHCATLIYLHCTAIPQRGQAIAPDSNV